MMSKRWLLFALFNAQLWAVPIGVAGPQEDYQRGYAAYRADDVVTAMQYLEKAADQGHGDARVLLAYILDKAEDDSRAIELYRQAAEQGNPAGQLGLGQMYASGEGVEQSNEAALEWIQRAADNGHVPAMMQLAEIYEKGALGMKIDEQKAQMLWRKAAALGNEQALKKIESMTQQ
jgi:TPR repeat protein